MPISHLNPRTAKLVSNSVVITSVYNVVKELLENAIDAGATSINVALDKHGVDRIEVRDNGLGICHADIPFVCLADHTSKIQDFSDLDQLSCYGFRGQALNAMCAVSDVSFTTRTSDDEVAMVYTVDKEGRITSSGPSYLGVGTTFTVKNLFLNLPVRRKILTTAPSNLRKILWLLRCYAISKPELAVALVHQGSNVWRKSSVHTLSSAIHEVLGYKLAVALQCIHWGGSISLTEEEDDNEVMEIEMDIVLPQKRSSILEFCSSQTSEGTTMNEYLIINGRPVKHKKLEKTMLSMISKGLAYDFPNRKRPPWVLILRLPANQLDVNLEADKSKVILRCEDLILAKVEEVISKHYGIQEVKDDESSQGSKIQSLKKKSGSQKSAGLVQQKSTPESISELSLNGEEANNSVDNEIEDTSSTLSYIPPPKQARYDVKVIGDTNNPHKPSPINNSCYSDIEKSPSVDSLEILSSEVASGRESHRTELLVHKNIINVNPSCSEDKVCGSYHIEVLEPAVDALRQEKESGNTDLLKGLNLDDIIGTFPGMEDVSKEVKDQMEDLIPSEDIGGPPDVVNGNNFDLETWSRGRVTANGALIGEPVTILLPKNNQERNIDEPSDSGLLSREPLPPTDSNKPQNKIVPTLSTSFGDSPARKESCQLIPSAKGLIASPSPNACSQLGRRDMRGFDCFASKMRPKILAEKPGMNFTEVASELARRWEALPDNERNELRKEGIAKAAARHSKRTDLEGGKLCFSTPSKKAASKPSVKLIRKTVQEKLQMTPVKPKEEKSPKIIFPPIGLTMEVSLDEIEQKLHERNKRASSKKVINRKKGRVSLVGQLKPSGMWIYKRGEELGILRHFALQESVVHQKLMSSFSVPVSTLASPIVFDERVLGPELWKKFLSLERQFDFTKQQTFITSDLIVKNGFCISLVQGYGENKTSALMNGIASEFPYYGIDDLKQVLRSIESGDRKLSTSRPLQVSTYIESEATRMCRQTSPVMLKHDVYNLLSQWNGLNQCLHSQLVLFPFSCENKVNEDLL